uniref:Uncharacterized protein n=1 Tax=Rhizophora mucronata TaxID=61149 RepID=A0A2P2P2U4_RHIMU
MVLKMPLGFGFVLHLSIHLVEHMVFWYLRYLEE